jgi:hypothetical protein
VPNFVETSTEVLDEGMADDDHHGGTVSLQHSHGSKPGFEAPVVGLQRVVGMDLGVMEGLREQLVEHSRVDAVPVGGDLDGEIRVRPTARSKKRRAAPVSRRGERYTSMTWPNWSMARNR